MQHYVLGFAFDTDAPRVALIRKNRPNWQAGKLNGVGGKVEASETALQAMRREFREETGADVSEEDWSHFGVLEGVDFLVWCFKTKLADFDALRSETDEAVESQYLTDSTWRLESISNLPALVYTALDPNAPFLRLSYREVALNEATLFNASQPL